jgi:DMSO/TMAO reductase YedYZ heme-binding membrane subunit
VSRGRAYARVGLAALGLAMVVMPPVVVGLSDTVSADALWATLRLAALEAFTLVSANLVIGSFRPLFNRVAKPRMVQRLHVTLDLVAFSLALAHGVMALVVGIAGYVTAPLWVGPAALAILALVIVTALTRRRLRRAWRWIHRLNYLVFIAVLVHGLTIGHDLGNNLFLKICFGVYAAVVVAGFAHRMIGILHRRQTSG